VNFSGAVFASRVEMLGGKGPGNFVSQQERILIVMSEGSPEVHTVNQKEEVFAR